MAADLGTNCLDDLLVTFEGQKWIAKDRISEKLLDKLWPNYEPALSNESCREVPLDDGVAKPSHCTESPRKTFKIDGLDNEADALVRQRNALLRCARLLKRVPSVEEALQFIKDNGLYSGEWKNSARRPRVRGILKFIAKTFDPKKCVKTDASTAAVNIWKYDAWAKKKFPNE